MTSGRNCRMGRISCTFRVPTAVCFAVVHLLSPVCSSSIGGLIVDKSSQSRNTASFSDEGEGTALLQITSAVHWPSCNVGPYSWMYYPVEVPEDTAVLSISLRKIMWEGQTDQRGPLLCFRKGGPPLPVADISSILDSVGTAANEAAQRRPTQDASGACAWFDEGISVNVTSDQDLPGLWELGFFSITNDSRTQSQMIPRGSVYHFELHVATYSCSGGGLILCPNCNCLITPLPPPFPPSTPSSPNPPLSPPPSKPIAPGPAPSPLSFNSPSQSEMPTESPSPSHVGGSGPAAEDPATKAAYLSASEQLNFGLNQQIARDGSLKFDRTVRHEEIAAESLGSVSDDGASEEWQYLRSQCFGQFEESKYYQLEIRGLAAELDVQVLEDLSDKNRFDSPNVVSVDITEEKPGSNLPPMSDPANSRGASLRQVGFDYPEQLRRTPRESLGMLESEGEPERDRGAEEQVTLLKFDEALPSSGDDDITDSHSPPAFKTGTVYLKRSSVPTAIEETILPPVILPELGIWYMTVPDLETLSQKKNRSEHMRAYGASGQGHCFTLRWKVRMCPPGRGSFDCGWSVLTLERSIPEWQPESVLDATYLPADIPSPSWMGNAWFPLTLGLPLQGKARKIAAPGSKVKKSFPPDGGDPSIAERLKNHGKWEAGMPVEPNLGKTEESRKSGLFQKASEFWGYFSLVVPSGASGSILTIDVKLAPHFGDQETERPSRERRNGTGTSQLRHDEESTETTTKFNSNEGAKLGESGIWKLEILGKLGGVPSNGDADIWTEPEILRSRTVGPLPFAESFHAGFSAHQDRRFESGEEFENLESMGGKILRLGGDGSVTLDIYYPARGTWYIGLRGSIVDAVNGDTLQDGRVELTDANSLNYFSGGPSPGIDNAPSYQPASEKSVQDSTLLSDRISRGTKLHGRSHSRGSSYTVSSSEEEMSVEVRVLMHGCPNACNGHGGCHMLVDGSRLHSVGYCYCDRSHGGTNCSVELVSPKEANKHIFVLVGSNLAAIFPSLWTIRHKAYAEWVIYTTSGVSSAIYHSCDSDGWCAADYWTLQFADFFLSFMAVVATFLFIAAPPPHAKLTAMVCFTIVDALIARDRATSGTNIYIVAFLGFLALAMAWTLEFARGRRLWQQQARTEIFRPVPWREYWTDRGRWSDWLVDVAEFFKRVVVRYRWPYLIAGFMALAASKLNWWYETAATYWIWHSLWHVSIYSSAYLFLCATESPIAETPLPPRSPDSAAGIEGVRLETAPLDTMEFLDDEDRTLLDRYGEGSSLMSEED